MTRDEEASKIDQFCGDKRWWDVEIVTEVAFGGGSNHRAVMKTITCDPKGSVSRGEPRGQTCVYTHGSCP